MNSNITPKRFPAIVQESTQVAIPRWLDLAMVEHQRSHCGSELYRNERREELARLIPKSTDPKMSRNTLTVLRSQ